MKKRSLFERIIALLLAIILAVPGYFGDGFVAHAAETKKEKPPVEVTAVNSNSPVSLSLEWADSEFKNGSALNIVEDANTSNTVKLKVSYSSEKVSESGYKPGDLIITVKGIGKVNRSGVIEAAVGADKQDAEVKNRDWSYTWNKASDTYTFTNNNEIKPNSVMSGYFEMAWTVKSRDSVHGYSQNNIKAAMILPDGSKISSAALSFSNKTLCDEYSIDIERAVLYSSNGVSGASGNYPDDEYVFVKYTITSYKKNNSRGASEEQFVFTDLIGDTAGVGHITYGNIPYTEITYGGVRAYQVTLKNNVTAGSEYIIVAYPRDTVGLTIKATASTLARFYEGNDSGNTEKSLVAQDSVEFTMPADFDFVDHGGEFDYIKNSYYEYKAKTDKNFANEVVKNGGHIAGSKMKFGTTEQFYLGFSMGGYTGKDGTYAFELIDDFLYITQNNGDYRQLNPKDYEFTQIVISSTATITNENDVPIKSGVYPVRIYAAQNGKIIELDKYAPSADPAIDKGPDSGDLVWAGLWMDYDQTITLPEGTTSVAVRYESLSESVWASLSSSEGNASTTCEQPAAIVTVDFHLSENGWEADQQSNLIDGQVVNTMAVNLYNNEGALVNNDVTADDYLDSNINIDLAQKDKDVYGRYMTRTRGSITFYGSEKSDYTAYTDIGKIERNGNKYTTQLTIGGNFNFKGDEYPQKFSLYTILPEKVVLDGYRLEDDIWDIMSLSGFGMSEDALAAHCTPEIVQNYNNSERTYIALHFNFTDKNVPQESDIRATFDLRIDRKFFRSTSSTINVRSAVILDKEANIHSIGKVVDNGKWDVDPVLSKDIDRDGNVEESLSYRNDWSTYTYVDSSELQLTKSIKTSTIDDYVQLPTVPYAEYGLDYSYEISLKNGNSISKNIVVIDVLETGPNAQWKGTFKSLDLSEAEKVGLFGKVYYSEKAKPGEIGSADWVETMDASKVKAVAIDFGSGELKAGGELNIYIHMTAPTDVALKDKVTENGFKASFVMLDAATGNETKYDSLESNFVQAKLSPPLYNIVLTKSDENNGVRLSGAKFSLVNKTTGEVVMSGTTNEIGLIVFKNVSSEGSYYIHEDEAPYGYELVADFDVVFDQNNKTTRIMVKDPRKLGRIEICKTNSLDPNMPVPGAEYTLYDAEGNVIGSAVTAENGIAVFTDIAWGSYTVKETATPDGYQLNETEYSVEINRETVADVIVIDTADVQDDVCVQLIKYEMTTDGVQTNIPLPGATFELVRKVGEENVRVGLYVTDENGVIEISEIPYGEYFFREYRTPVGYNKAEDKDFVLDPSNKDPHLVVYDQRKSGSIIIAKTDNLGNFVQGAEFTLYDADKNELLKVVTDEYGTAHIDNLEWGTYFLKETLAPDYYVMDEEWREIVIGAENLTVNVRCVNETVKGSVRITKTDETEQVFLDGAEFTLYASDGTVVGVYTTDENGQLLVENLEWGGYYFKETKAPLGYGLAPDTIRFSINSMSAGLTQELHVVDPKDSRYIVLTKRIKADEINFANGAPTFVFKLEGVDVNGVSHTYHQVVAFDKDYVKKNTDSNGYVSQDVLFTNLTAGSYTASEMDSARYILEGISDVVNGSVNGKTAILDIVNNPNAAATFTNKNYEYQDFSDTGNLMNILKKQAKLTSLNVTYGASEVEAQSDVDISLLKVMAVYDDGSTEEVPEGQYILSNTWFPNQNGECVVTVRYTEGGITRSGSFAVNIYGQVPVIMSMTATDGFAVKNGKIVPRAFQVTATYNDGTTGILSPEQYTVSPGVAPDYEGDIEVVINLDLNVTRNEERPVSTTATVTVQPMPILMNGPSFYGEVPYGTGIVVFTDVPAPDGISLKDVSAAQDGSVVAWSSGGTFYVSSQKPEVPIAANADSSKLFYDKWYLDSVDASMLDTSNVTDMNNMFYRCSNLTSLDGISSWDTSKVTNMQGTFGSCSRLVDVEGLKDWDVSSVTNLANLFYNCKSLTDLNWVKDWDTSNVLTLSSTFYGCNGLTSLDSISGWNTSNVNNMYGVFENCGRLKTLNLSEWDTSNVNYMEGIFHGCTSLETINLSGWDVSGVGSLYYVFCGCENLESFDTISQWDVSNVSNFSFVFDGCKKIKDLAFLKEWDLQSATNLRGMFEECSGLTDISLLQRWDVSKVTNIGRFLSDTSITNIDALANWDVSSVSDMRGLFWGCIELTDVSALAFWDTSCVKSTGHLFRDCTGLKYINLSGWDTSKVEDMTGMFSGCINLEAIYVTDKWSTKSETSVVYQTIDNMFYNCKALVGGNGTKYNSRYMHREYARIDKSGSPGYLTLGADIVAHCNDVAIGDTIQPDVSINPSIDASSISYDVVSGAECIRLNTANGAITGITDGKAIIEVTGTTFDGTTVTSQFTITVLSPIQWFRYTYDGGLTAGCVAAPNIRLNPGWSVQEYKITSGNDCVSIDVVTGEITCIAKGDFEVEVIAINENGFTATGKASLTVYSPVTRFYYDFVCVGETRSPIMGIRSGWSVTGYRIVSGEDFASIDTTTGQLTGIAEGEVDVEVTVTSDKGYTESLITYVNIASPINYFCYDQDVYIGATAIPYYEPYRADAGWSPLRYRIVSGSEFASIDAITGQLTGIAEGEVCVEAVFANNAGLSVTKETSVFVLMPDMPIRYKCVPVGGTIEPTMAPWLSIPGYSVSYEIANGGEHIRLNEQTGAITGISESMDFSNWEYNETDLYNVVVNAKVQDPNGKVITKQVPVIVQETVEFIVINECEDVVSTQKVEYDPIADEILVSDSPYTFLYLSGYAVVPVNEKMLVDLVEIKYAEDGEEIIGACGDIIQPVAPGVSITITNVELIEGVIIESEHYPYPGSMNSVTDGIEGKVYGEVYFEGATSLTVGIDCETEHASLDWVDLYDADGNLIKFYGGPWISEEIVVPGNYVKIVFRTNESNNDYFGFWSLITPNYD